MASFLLGGCQPKDREVIVRESGQAWDHAAKAASTAWDSAMVKIKEITPESTQSALDSAKESAVSLQKKLEGIPNPTPEITKQLEGARQSLAKVDAAQTVRDLQTKSESMITDARQKGENAGKSIEDLRKQLATANENFQTLQKQLAEARANFETANKKLEQLTGKSN